MQIDPTDRGLLGLDAMRALRQEDPARLFQYLSEVEQSFLFGVEDRREEGGWGGALRVLLNRNIELHLVSGFNDDMETVDELPQFCVLPDDDRADTSLDTEQTVDGETIKGVVFYVEPQDYDMLCADAVRVAEDYPGWDLVPDSYFLGTELVAFLNRVVLEHPTVRAEREFDFKRGLIGGRPPTDEPEDEPPPEIREDDEDGPERHLRSVKL